MSKVKQHGVLVLLRTQKLLWHWVMVFPTLDEYYQTFKCKMEVLCIVKGELSMVNIDLTSLSQGGLTEEQTMFIVISVFFACAVGEWGAIKRRGGFNTNSFVHFCHLSLSPGYWRILVADKRSLSVIDVTAGLFPLKGNEEFTAM